MKHTDPIDESREHFIDGLIDAAIDAERRHMEEKGRLLKQRIQGQLDNDKPQEWPFENGWWGPVK